MSFDFPTNRTLLGMTPDGHRIYFDDIKNPRTCHYTIKNEDPSSQKPSFIEHSCDFILDGKGNWNSTPIINYNDTIERIDSQYAKQLLQNYFDNKMWKQFQQNIPEWDKTEALQRFINVMSDCIKGFDNRAWLVVMMLA
jgi:hypothetical protein